ncbi:MAG: site-specific integrase [Pseudomonadota bacterium]
MLPFQVRNFGGRSGEEIFVLTRRAGEPYFYPNVFATADYRNAGKSPNTTARVLRSIGMAIMWAESKAIDFDRRLVEENFISVSDVDDLVHFLGLTAAEQVARYAERLKVAPSARSKVVNLETYRPHPRGNSAAEVNIVSSMEVGARIRWVAKYAEWLLNRRLHNMEVIGQQTAPLRVNAEAAIRRLRSLAPSVSGFVDDDRTLEAPEFEIIRQIEELLRPDSQSNPFCSPFIKARNYLIWRLLRDTGARRHEVHGARSSDIHYAERRFAIVKSKTLPRTVLIQAKTAEAFDNYVMDFWTRLPHGSASRKSGHIFCDENGKHLSLRAINRIFETVRERIDKTPQKISPHAMRRFWNHLLSQKIDSLPEEQRISAQEEATYRMRIMGWSSDTQAKRYNRRHIREAGDRIAQSMMDDLEK